MTTKDPKTSDSPPQAERVPSRGLQGVDPDPAVFAATRLPAGACGLICGIEGDREDVERLKVMGLCLGRRLHVIKSGNPLIVSVMGTRIGLARELAEFVSVRADVGQACIEDQPDP